VDLDVADPDVTLAFSAVFGAAIAGTAIRPWVTETLEFRARPGVELLVAALVDADDVGDGDRDGHTTEDRAEGCARATLPVLPHSAGHAGAEKVDTAGREQDVQDPGGLR
jgi:hypothetical protein